MRGEKEELEERGKVGRGKRMTERGENERETGEKRRTRR